MDLAASIATGVADQARLDIGQPQLVGPAIGVHHAVMVAMVVAAIDEDAAHAGSAHFAEGDFLRIHLRGITLVFPVSSITDATWRAIAAMMRLSSSS